MTQDEPIMHGATDASDESRVAGIVEQVRSDTQPGGSEDSERLLRQRLDEAGLQLPEDEISRIARDIRSGSSAD